MGVKKSFESRVSEIAEQYRYQSIEREPISLIYAEVSAVDEQAKIMDAVTDDGYTLSGISLEVIPNGSSSILIFPEIGSRIVVGFIENEPELKFIVSYTQATRVLISNKFNEEDSYIDLTQDSISLKYGSTVCTLENDTLSLSTDGQIIVNSGSNGGVPLAQQLANTLNRVIVSAFNSHTHTNGNNGAPTGPPIQTMSNVSSGDYENEDFTQ